ncbi:uncharacterized protein [Macrobrachium rosenbergii]|uniref:uncharacterized protein n=1 Tax=Macrobrachium rosenbergii TaxID=79674 RepID=UPI0034D5DA26
MAHISDDATKSDIIMTALPEEVFSRISPWVDALPDKVTNLKNKLLNSYYRLSQSMRRRYHWPFVIVDVKFPLVGADFLGHHGLLVDVARQRLLNTGTCHSRQPSTIPGMPSISSTAPNSYVSLLQEFPDVFKPELHQSPGASTKHGIFHHITTMDPPTHAKFRRLSPRKLQGARQAFAAMERMGICKKASSPSASPLHMPQTIKALQEFLGMINYYRRFILDVAHIMYPLTSILKGKPKTLTWEAPQQQAFIQTKRTLSSATTLTHHNPAAALRLTTDTSSITCCAVLEQLVNGTPQPLAFFSHKLSPAETCYSAFDRELLAIYQAGDTWSARQQQHLTTISEFGCTINYVPGKRNPVADALSRIEINSLHLAIDYEDLARKQAADPETADYRTAVMALKWEDVPLANSGHNSPLGHQHRPPTTWCPHRGENKC